MRLRGPVVFVVALVLTGGPGVAAARPVAATSPYLDVEDVVGDGPDDLVEFYGAGFAPDQSVDVVVTDQVGGTQFALPSTVARSDGTFDEATGTRTPATLTPGSYRLTATQAGAGRTATSAPFTIVAPSVSGASTVVPGDPDAGIGLQGLGGGPDVHRQVTIDGVAVASSQSEHLGLGMQQYFAIPDTLTPGAHRITVTQDVNPTFSSTIDSTVVQPTLSVHAPAPFGTRSWLSATGVDFGLGDDVAVTVTDGAGTVHLLPSGSGPHPGLGPVIVANLAPGQATLAFVSRHNGARATATFTVYPNVLTAPVAVSPMATEDGSGSLGLQSDGNLVLRFLGNPLWATGTTGHPGARLVLQSDANLVLYDAAGRAYWSTGTSGFGTGARLMMNHDGNAELFAANGRPLWSTTTLPGQLSLPDDTRLLAGHAMPKGAYIATSSGDWPHLGVHSDGNAVFTGFGGRVLWTSRTGGHPNAVLDLQTDGNLVMYSATNQVLWANYAHTGPGSRLVAQSDGNLVEYTAQNVAVWSTHTRN